MKDILNTLSTAVSSQKTSSLLHSMAASKDILFWTPRGQLLRNQRIIPVTNISELVEYVFLSYNDDVTKPRAVNTIVDGLAGLGIDKIFTKNKNVLIDLWEKEKDYQDKKEETNSGNEEDEVDLDQNGEEEEAENSASEIRCQLRLLLTKSGQNCKKYNLWLFS